MEKELQVQPFLLKHTGAVHINVDLTHTQRALFNYCIFEASKEKFADKFYDISYSDIHQILGWKPGSKINQWLFNQLEGLVTKPVKWNVFDQDKKNNWTEMGACGCLSDVKIKDGKLSFRFGGFFRSVFMEMSLYAKINLDIQKKLDSRYALALYEYTTEHLARNKIKDCVISEWRSCDSMIRFFCGIESKYLEHYYQFKKLALRQAILEVNLHADFHVELIEKKEGRKIQFIAFKITKKDVYIDLSAIDTKAINEDIEAYNAKMEKKKILEEKILKIVGSQETVNALMSKNNYEDIEKAIGLFDYYAGTQSPIGNPVAFLHKALKEKWITPSVAISSTHTDNISVNDRSEQEINNSNDSPEIQDIRLGLLAKLGSDVYKHWFSPHQITLTDSMITFYCESSFSQNWIKDHFFKDIEVVLCKLNYTQKFVISLLKKI
jgi:hypothetical protein